jgi:hypothetical protein
MNCPINQAPYKKNRLAFLRRPRAYGGERETGRHKRTGIPEVLILTNLNLLRVSYPVGDQPLRSTLEAPCLQ